MAIANLLGRWAIQAVSEKDLGELVAPISSSESVPPPDMLTMTLKMFVALGAVVALLLLLAYLLRRYFPGQTTGRRSERIDVLATRPLGARKSLVLARVRDRVVLLGITPQKITCLSEIDERLEPWRGAKNGSVPSAEAGELSKELADTWMSQSTD